MDNNRKIEKIDEYIQRKQTEGTLTLPVLPLRAFTLFPGVIIELPIGRTESINAINNAYISGKHRYIFLVSQKDKRVIKPVANDIFQYGVIGELLQYVKLSNGSLKILIEGMRRARIESVNQRIGFMEAMLSIPRMETGNKIILEAHIRNLKNLFLKYSNLNKSIDKKNINDILDSDDNQFMLNMLSAHIDIKNSEKQEILELNNLEQIAEKLVQLFEKEIDILNINKKIHNTIQNNLAKTQREYYLQEQYKAIKEELGLNTNINDEINQYRKRLELVKPPENVRQVCENEINKLSKTSTITAEATVIRNYLDILLDMPWKSSSPENRNINKAVQILENSHYGLKEVKERIIELISIRHLKKGNTNTILCFTGPPGVGKTSLAESIAKALNRKFIRVSLGGLRDTAEIIGHRRTYIGALPGRIIQSLRRVGVRNPVFLLDEIDKIGSGVRGDPAAALLEVLDPEQNSNFSDHYLEIPFDLSNVMFITTANSLETIMSPLRDRMELIRLNGYIESEKKEIAKNYLIKKNLIETGLNKFKIEFQDKAIVELIRYYTAEAGVRQLDRKINRLLGKIAKRIVVDKDKKIQNCKIKEKDIIKYLGRHKYRPESITENLQPGMVIGLAWTINGGDILFIEVSILKGTGQLFLTGKLGDIIKESAQTAFSFIKKNIEKGKNINYFRKHDLHIHIPMGAVPKDGPSAGITIASAIYSAFKNKTVDNKTAMTGELTLTGRILPIGGVKEKAIAAHRSGITRIILPEENRDDLDDVPIKVKNDIEFVFCDNMNSILKLIFRNK